MRYALGIKILSYSKIWKLPVHLYYLGFQYSELSERYSHTTECIDFSGNPNDLITAATLSLNTQLCL